MNIRELLGVALKPLHSTFSANTLPCFVFNFHAINFVFFLCIFYVISRECFLNIDVYIWLHGRESPTFISPLPLRKMEHQAIVIVDKSVKENEITGAEMRGMKSVSNGASSSMPQDERKENDEARHWHDEARQTRKARLDYSLPLIEHRLGERRSRVRGNGRSSSICFFPLPRTIHTIKQRLST